MGRLSELFAESGKSQSMRRLAAVAVYDDLRLHRPPWCSVDVALTTDVLRVALVLWWPWWLLLGLAHVGTWLNARRRVLRGLRRLQIPMRIVKVRVTTRKRKPTR